MANDVRDGQGRGEGKQTQVRPCVDVERLVVGPLQNNVYLIHDGQGVTIVDPTAEPDRLLAAVGDRPLSGIVLTHHHSDHMGAACALRAATGAPVIASAIEQPLIEQPKKVGTSPLPLPEACPVDIAVSHGDVVKIGELAWKVLVTPGHSKGSMCLYIVPQLSLAGQGAPTLVSGDTLFEGTIGRTDFEGGSMDDMRASLFTLAKLPDDTIVLPGHGNPTTIGAERERVFARYAQ